MTTPHPAPGEPPYLIAEKEPVFPCWMHCTVSRPYNSKSYGWEKHYAHPGLALSDYFDLWWPDQPEAPATRPPSGPAAQPNEETQGGEQWDTEIIVRNLSAACDNADRLAKLPLNHLFHEVLSSDAGDMQVVIELLNRLWPNWVNEPDTTFELSAPPQLAASGSDWAKQAAIELHAQNWSAMTYDTMVAQGAAIIARHAPAPSVQREAGQAGELREALEAAKLRGDALQREVDRWAKWREEQPWLAEIRGYQDQLADYHARCHTAGEGNYLVHANGYLIDQKLQIEWACRAIGLPLEQWRSLTPAIENIMRRLATPAMSVTAPSGDNCKWRELFGAREGETPEQCRRIWQEALDEQDRLREQLNEANAKIQELRDENHIYAGQCEAFRDQLDAQSTPARSQAQQVPEWMRDYLASWGESVDPLVLMNDLTRWQDPPPYEERWAKRVAAACDIAAYFKKLAFAPAVQPTEAGELSEAAAVIKEQLDKALMWEKHYKGDPEGKLDEAFWQGRARGLAETLDYVTRRAAMRATQQGAKPGAQEGEK